MYTHFIKIYKNSEPAYKKIEVKNDQSQNFLRNLAGRNSLGDKKLDLLSLN